MQLIQARSSRVKLSRCWHLIVIMAALCISAARAETAPIRLATTTSTVNSGLLDFLLPNFERRTGTKVKIVSVGTGKALRLGREGKVDVVLVHAPAAEESFVAAGYGVLRHKVMHNDFVIVGPQTDHAGIKGMTDAGAALRQIARTESKFVSRGDDSGTHKKELALWKQLDIDPYGTWYHEIGKGMSATLLTASEMAAYLLIDRGTWLAHRDTSNLVILTEGDERLFNPYGIIAVNPAKHPGVNHKGSSALIEWITSSEAATLIESYQVNGEKLFVPKAKVSTK